MTTVDVRPFRIEDRPVVRRICHRVGFMGTSADWYWRHAESFADIWTGYYTDVEPESFFVAVRAGEVVGFLAGCVESRRAPSPVQALTQQAIRHALFFRPGTAGFLWRGLWDSIRERGTPNGSVDDPRWPSHLHINLLPDARGCGAGAALMAAWLARLRAVGSSGCHLGTLLENQRALGFFERMGFRRLGGPTLVPGMRLRTGGRMHLQLMARDVAPGP